MWRPRNDEAFHIRVLEMPELTLFGIASAAELASLELYAALSLLR